MVLLQEGKWKEILRFPSILHEVQACSLLQTLQERALYILSKITASASPPPIQIAAIP
jgi:hypothetical protein